MARTEWHRIQEVLEGALERRPVDRPAYLDVACAGNSRLRQEVESLLAGADEVDRFLESGIGLFAGAGMAGPIDLAGRSFGAFVLERRIGSGGMGEVYLAHDTTLDRRVALKILPPDLARDAEHLSRFEREARLLASVNHANIAVIHGLARADGQLALVLEYVPGTTLAEHLRGTTQGAPLPGTADSGESARGVESREERPKNALPIDQALMLARAVAEALAAAHRAGVIHRDLKPSNVMVTRSGIKLLDFGVAKVVDRRDRGGATEADPRDPATAEGVVIGTMPYMAPEQLRGAVLDHRCDIFAFGVLVYEMVSGRHPFAGPSDADTIAAILERTPDPLASWRDDVPPGLDRLVQKCLRKDPDDRWQSASDLVEAIEWAQEERRTPPRSSGRGEPNGTGRRAPPRWQLSLVAGCLGAVGLAVVAATWWRPPPRAGERPLEFVIPPAPRTSWGVVPVAPNPAVSPNGRYVALVARADGESGIWLHDLESGTARLLLRSGEGALQPFWSPDSSTVAVCDKEGIRTVGLDDRPPELVKAPRCTDGAWHAEGGWLLSSDQGLIRMRPQGGPPEPVTTLNTARGELRHVYGRWLPDGRHFVFLLRAQTPDLRGIYVGSIDHTPPERLLNENANPVYVTEGGGRGLLLYVRAGTLVAQGFDETRLALRPEIFPLGQRVRLGITARSGSFDASDRLLVFRSGASYQPTRLIWLDRAGREIGEVGPDDAYRLEPSLSPDEKTLLYGRFNEETNLIEVWASDLERGVAAPLLRSSADSLEAPLWSPNGRFLAYLSAERGAYLPWLVDPSGARRPVIDTVPTTPGHAAAAGTGLDLAWTPDSRYLLRQVEGGVRGLAVDGSAQSVPVVNREVSAQVSPDGRWVAYAAADTGRQEVYVERFGGGEVRRVSLDSGFSPRWRADGSELFFRAAPDRMMAVDVHLGDTLRIGRPRVLFRAPFEPFGTATAGAVDYLVTRDAQRFLITVPVVSMKPLTARLNWRMRLRQGAPPS